MSSYSDIDITSDSSRNYTLELQGLSSIVTCAYVIESVINVVIPLQNMWQTNGTCATPEQNIFADNTTFISLPSNNYLAFWACQTAQSGDSYNLYLRGVGAYFAPEIGNITCIVSPIQPAVFEVNYSGQVLTVAQSCVTHPFKQWNGWRFAVRDGRSGQPYTLGNCCGFWKKRGWSIPTLAEIQGIVVTFQCRLCAFCIESLFKVVALWWLVSRIPAVIY